MASTIMKNALAEGLLRSAGVQALDLYLPPEDPDGICTAQAVAVGNLNIDGAAVKSLVANGKCVLVRPACPVFTFSDAGIACSIEMAGTNQWGELVTWNIIRTAGSALVTKTLPGSGRIPPMWTIDYIKVTVLTTAAGANTVSVGFNYSVGNSQSIALPISLARDADLQGLTRLIAVEELDGFWTGGPWPNLPSVTTGNAEDIKRGVLAVTLGTTTASSTAAIETNANFTAATWTVGTLTLTKTAAFAGYEFRAGDTITAVSGTGFSGGTYAIASKVDNDNITLATSPGAGGAADAVFRINDGATAGLFLFKTSAFAGLPVAPGTTISITGGTGVRAGTYLIKERRSANLITLTTDPGGTNPTDVTFTLGVAGGGGGNTKWGKLRLILAPEVINYK